MNGPGDLAKGWLQKADSDLAKAQLVLSSDGPCSLMMRYNFVLPTPRARAVRLTSQSNCSRAFSTSPDSKVPPSQLRCKRTCLASITGQ
jgi:hypothetical protein